MPRTGRPRAVASTEGDADAGHQPEPGAGVEGLAQLDGHDPGQRDRSVRRGCAMRRRDRSPGAMVAHAAAPSRWSCAVSSRNISSSPAPSAARSSTRVTAARWATRPTCAGSASTRSASEPPVPATGAVADAGDGERGGEGTTVRGADEGAGGAEEIGLRPLGDDAPAADHHEVVGDHLDLVQQVRGEQHGGPGVGVAAQQVTHPADAGGVETVGRLVEDQYGGVAEQSRGDAEPLPHAERVVTHPAARFPGVEADPGQHLLDPVLRQAHGALGDGEDLPSGAPRVLGRGVQQDPHLPTRVGQVAEGAAADLGPSGGGGGETHQDPHRRGLAGAVGAEEAGDPARLGGEADVVDGGEAAVPLGHPVGGDHAVTPAAPSGSWTRMATLPRTRPASSSRMASGARLSG